MDPTPPRNPLGTSRTAPFVVRFEIGANNGAEHTPRGLRESMLSPFAMLDARPQSTRAQRD
eukprot:14073411-Alexandrium_andersonii.AAC.1